MKFYQIAYIIMSNKKIKVADKYFELYLTENEIVESIDNLAVEINKDLEGVENPLYLTVLTGGFMFAGHLLKRVNVAGEVAFVRLSSYSGMSSTEKVKEIMGLSVNPEGRTIIIIEDIVDTGITLEHYRKVLYEKGAKEVKIAALLFKPQAFQKDYKVDYVAKEIPNDFIVGFGLDYKEYGRNLADIYKVCE